MPCTHKFFSDPNHLPNENGLIPKLEIETLFIGTFNPSQEWNPTNNAVYFYGRRRNYFWRLLSEFTCNQIEIDKSDYQSLIEFLQHFKIGLTDIIIRINDADLNNNIHIDRIKKFRDADLETFNKIDFNTNQIIAQLKLRKIKQVFITRSGIYTGSIEQQFHIIETFCNTNNILFKRLHTPSGQGLGVGTPRFNKLINKWYEQGADQFQFLCSNFNINNYPFIA
ncbi:MAG: hypothetical protein IE931_10700 [Sphingobacteriales bacterium]|nr:hypothetical protein [Sphingobacteriales bacterium]